jgi:STE24 endopeptidase
MEFNAYFWVILATLIGFYVLDFVANWLNMRSLKSALPADFSRIYDEQAYARMVDYTREKTKFYLLESTFEIGVGLAFWFLGGFPFVDAIVRGWHLGPILSGLVFIGILAAGRDLLSLPFEAYHTFGIEQRFGFNRTTVSTFVTDHAKSIALRIVLGGPLLALVLALFQYTGSHDWFYGWIATSVVMLALTYAAPAIILPMFNKFSPLEDGPLKAAILEYTRTNHFPLEGLYVMDGSKRSTKANAFFTGFGRTRKIALFDTLIANHTIGELVAVLAHEIGHFKLHHIVKYILLTVLNLGIFFFLASLFIHSGGLFDAFGVPQRSVYCGLALFLMLFTPISRMLSMLAGLYSRRNEFAADRFAADTTHNAGELISALKKLSKSHLENLKPHPLYVLLYYSHPPVLQRIDALRRVSA